MIALLKQQRDLRYACAVAGKIPGRSERGRCGHPGLFRENKDRFVNPDQVQLQFIELKLAQIAEDIKISEEELRTSYQSRSLNMVGPRNARLRTFWSSCRRTPAKPKWNRPVPRHGRWLTAFTPAPEFRSGSTGRASRSIRRVEGANLGVITQGMFASPAFETAQYAMKKPGEVSDPVQMPSGFHIIRLDSITPAGQAVRGSARGCGQGAALSTGREPFLRNQPTLANLEL